MKLLSKNVPYHSQTVGHRKRCEETTFYKCVIYGTHSLPVIKKMWWDCFPQNLQCYSQTVGDRNRCNLFLTSATIGLTCCWSQKWMWWDCLPQTCAIANIAHRLLVIGKDMMRLHFAKCANSLPVDHRKRCNDTAFHKDVQCCSHPVSH